MSKNPYRQFKNTKFKKFLKSQYDMRRENNPLYSIRAFAQFLNIDQSHLTKVLLGKRTISDKSKEACLRRLKVEEKLIPSFLCGDENRIFHIEDETYLELISDWKNLAILEALTLKDIPHTEAEISLKLNMSPLEVNNVLARLISMGLISKDGDEFEVNYYNDSWPKNLIASERQPAFQKEILEKKIHAFENVPLELRDHGTITVAIDKKLMPKFKEILSRYRRELVEQLQQSSEFDEVYQLTISLFPLSKLSRGSDE